MTLACVPWTLRNVRALGGVVFVRSNFGLELRMGNHEGAGATLEQSARGGTERHPRTNLAEAEKVARLGELEYMRETGREATGWIRAHPGHFARLTALRVAQFWLGPVDDLPVAAGMTLLTVLAVVGAARTFPRLGGLRRVAILVPLATFPLVYYLVGFEARYRQPLDGLLLLLAAAAFTSRDAAAGPSPAPPAFPRIARTVVMFRNVAAMRSVFSIFPDTAIDSSDRSRQSQWTSRSRTTRSSFGVARPTATLTWAGVSGSFRKPT
jgi:hypothetical protein